MNEYKRKNQRVIHDSITSFPIAEKYLQNNSSNVANDHFS